MDDADDGMSDVAVAESDETRIVFADPVNAHPNFLLPWHDEMHRRFESEELPKCLEVRAIPSMSRVGLPCQLGVVNVGADIPMKTNLMFYGIHPIDHNDRNMVANGMQYVKSVGGSSQSKVLDGKPYADAFRRIIPQNQAQVDALDAHVGAIFMPDAAVNRSLTAEHIVMFKSVPYGFMVNCHRNRHAKNGAKMTTNCKWVQLGQATQEDFVILVLCSTKIIKTSDELVYDYKSTESRALFGAASDTVAAKSLLANHNWILQMRTQSALRAIDNIRECFKYDKRNDKRFPQYSGDIIFLLRNVIFNARGKVAVS